MATLLGQEFTPTSYEFCKRLADDLMLQHNESIAVCHIAAGYWVGPLRNMRGTEVYRAEA